MDHIRHNTIAITGRNSSIGLQSLLFLILLSGTLESYGQQKFCADSSIRIKYFFNYNNAELLTYEDTSGKNFFIGFFNQSSSPTTGISLFRTNWGDSIYWAKRFYTGSNTNLPIYNANEGPAGTLICNGVWGNSSDLLFCRIDTNGNLLWSKRYRLSQSHIGYSTGNRNYKNVMITNNAIYFTVMFAGGGGPTSTSNIIGKLDLDGNIIWTKSFEKNITAYTSNSISDAPVLYKDTVLIVSNIVEYNNITGQILKKYPVITKLKDADGSIIENIAYKIAPGSTIKGIIPKYLKLNTDNNFSLTGVMSISQTINGDPSYGSNLTFNLTLDNNLTPVYSSYYDFNPSLNLDGQNYTFDFNHRKENVFLYDVGFGNNKYFVSFDDNKNILRSRKFLLPPINTFRSYINFDDKQNIHFIYNYKQNNKAVAEYARLTDLSPANTVSCFGVDTSILQPVPFLLTKEPFTWDIEYTNIVSSFPVNLLEAPETITKQVVCKQVSYCDSLKIKGNPAVSICLSGADVRYTAYLNPQCLKSINWQTDTSIANIINYEADSAVTIHFNKAGQFYLKALVNNCVVADSILITVTKPQTALQLTKADSLLCPGKSILLRVNPFFKTYQWQDGSNQNSYTVTTPGLYTITAIDSCGNMVTDSIRIKQDNTVIPVAPYYKICVYDTVNVLLPASIRNITWQPALFGSLSGNRLLIYPLQTTIYTIQAQSAQGCSMQKQVTVETEVCPEWVRFPSAFTPNNDGLNDSFRPGVSGHLVSYNLKVFDRNGQIVFSSKNPFAGWDGKLKGAEQDSGIFVFLCYYRFIDKAQMMDKGTIMLIR